jgi:redox-sensitive bicupin YhaK (pirin superfamily)
MARPVDGVEARVIAGAVGDVLGPVQAVATDPTYLDLALAPGARYVHALPEGHNAFVYPFEGSVTVGSGTGARALATRELGALSPGSEVEIVAGDVPARALLIAGRPLREPIAKYGPFVMNTEAEIYQAVADLRAGKF